MMDRAVVARIDGVTLGAEGLDDEIDRGRGVVVAQARKDGRVFHGYSFARLARRVRLRAAPVLDGFDSGRDAARGQAGGKELARRAVGELAEVAVEVRLVEVAAVVGELGPAQLVCLTEPADDAVEADHARDRLRRQPDLL